MGLTVALEKGSCTHMGQCWLRRGETRRGQGKWGEHPGPAFTHKKDEAELCPTMSREASGAVESTSRMAANQEQLMVSLGMWGSPEGPSPAPPPTMDPASSYN